MASLSMVLNRCLIICSAYAFFMPGTVLGLEMSRTWPFFVAEGREAKDWLIKNNYSSGSCSQEALESLLLPRAAQWGGHVRRCQGKVEGGTGYSSETQVPGGSCLDLLADPGWVLLLLGLGFCTWKMKRLNWMVFKLSPSLWPYRKKDPLPWTWGWSWEVISLGSLRLNCRAAIQSIFHKYGVHFGQ